MGSVVPSYITKVTRAKKHLVDLEDAVKRFADKHPYTARKRVEGKKKRTVYRLTFTASPANTDIPIIAADVIYNLRSALDHLMSALVAPKDRGSAMFPIFFQGVWEAIVPGENAQRVKERTRWASDIKTLPDDAITVLKKLQPNEATADEPVTNFIQMVNRFSNRDRHERLPVVASGLADLTVTVTMPDGSTRSGIGQYSGERALQNEAQLHDIPHDAVDVQIRGTTVVALPAGVKNRYIEIPLRLSEATNWIESSVIPPLMPFVRPDAA